MKRAPAFLAPLIVLLVACGPQSSSDDPAESAAVEPEISPGFVREAAVFEAQDPELHRVFEQGVSIEVLAEGFTWSEGPVWIANGSFLLFSDVPQDTIYRWSEADGLAPWIQPSGHTTELERSREPGANGLYLDAEGRLVLCQHGDRRVARLGADATAGPWLDGSAPLETITADFEGARFNSPNDLVIAKDGSIYFTDPPYGLIDESARELEHHGVYHVAPDGTTRLLTGALSRPNGIALSPDGTQLYVANSNPEKALWIRWSVEPDGQIKEGEGQVLHDATAMVSEERPGLPDGMAVDGQGRLFATGPGGLWVFAADGRHLGTLRLPAATANVTFGDDGGTLYLTSNDRLLRVRTQTIGLGFTG